MATVVNLYEDTRWGDMGAAIGEGIGTYFGEKRKKRKLQELMDALESQNTVDKEDNEDQTFNSRENMQILMTAGIPIPQAMQIIGTLKADFNSQIDEIDETRDNLRVGQLLDIPTGGFTSKQVDMFDDLDTDDKRFILQHRQNIRTEEARERGEERERTRIRQAADTAKLAEARFDIAEKDFALRVKQDKRAEEESARAEEELQLRYWETVDVVNPDGSTVRTTYDVRHPDNVLGEVIFPNTKEGREQRDDAGAADKVRTQSGTIIKPSTVNKDFAASRDAKALALDYASLLVNPDDPKNPTPEEKRLLVDAAGGGDGRTKEEFDTDMDTHFNVGAAGIPLSPEKIRERVLAERLMPFVLITNPRTQTGELFQVVLSHVQNLIATGQILTFKQMGLMADGTGTFNPVMAKSQLETYYEFTPTEADEMITKLEARFAVEAPKPSPNQIALNKLLEREDTAIRADLLRRRQERQDYSMGGIGVLSDIIYQGLSAAGRTLIETFGYTEEKFRSMSLEEQQEVIRNIETKARITGSGVLF